MIPYEEEKWLHIARLPSGDLGRISYSVLLAAFARTRSSVVIEIRRKPVEKRIVVEHGSPVDCRSNLVHETLGRFLVSNGKLTPEQLNTTLAESLSRRVPLGEVLLEKELLDPVELYRQLQQNLARKLLDPFTWRDGEFRISEESAGSETSLKVRTPQLILTGVLKLSSMDEVSEGIQPFLAEPLAYNPSPPIDRDELVFRGAAERVVEALRERPLRMDELAISTNVVPDDLGRIVYGLALLDVVIPASRLAMLGARKFTKKVLQTRPIEPPAYLEGPMSEEQLEKTKRQVLEAYLSFRRKDSIELLDLDEEDDRDRIERHFIRFSRRFAPWRLGGQVSDDILEKARIIFLAGAEAYVELADGERRGLLLERRRRRRDDKAEHSTVSFKIETDLLDPEVQFNKGLRLLEQGDHDKARELLEFAADCDPQNARYRAEAAHCRFVAVNALDSALVDLRAAVRIDPSCGIAFYYLGEVLGESGELEEAEEVLRKAIKLMAPDRRPINALKALSGKAKRH